MRVSHDWLEARLRGTRDVKASMVQIQSSRPGAVPPLAGRRQRRRQRWWVPLLRTCQWSGGLARRPCHGALRTPCPWTRQCSLPALEPQRVRRLRRLSQTPRWHSTARPERERVWPQAGLARHAGPHWGDDVANGACAGGAPGGRGQVVLVRQPNPWRCGQRGTTAGALHDLALPPPPPPPFRTRARARPCLAPCMGVSPRVSTVSTFTSTWHTRAVP